MKKTSHRTPHTPPDWQPAYQAALAAGTAANTRLAYTRDLRYFTAWAQATGLGAVLYPIPIDTVIRFILDHTTTMEKRIEDALLAQGLRAKAGPLRIRTLRRYLASLSIAHAEHGVASPMHDTRITMLLRRVQRTRAGELSLRKAALTADLLARLLATCDDSLAGVRDRAVISVGFASGGRRRSEIASLQVADLRWIKDGYIIRLRTSKTDQAGEGQDAPLLGEAAAALKAWLVRSGIREGKLFRAITPNGTLGDGLCGRTVNRIVKKRAALAGLDPALFGAHSLRSGFVTESGRQGLALRDAMALSGHRTHSVANGYHQEGELLRNPAARLLR